MDPDVLHGDPRGFEFAWTVTEAQRKAIFDESIVHPAWSSEPVPRH